MTTATQTFPPLSQAILDPLDEPVFIDLETRSAADLPKVGGWNYAAHETTHLLTVAWSPAPDEYHIWYPWHSPESIRQDYVAAQQTKVTTHFGVDLPEALERVLHRRWCAHNAWNFDQLVWEKLFGELQRPAEWIDSEPLARVIGLPGQLDAIGKRLWGEGKYAAAKTTLKKYTRDARNYGDAADVPAGVMPMLAEYNVRDVKLLRQLWQEIIAWLKMPQNEWDVLSAHREVNHRGAAIDQDLLVSLIDLTEEGKYAAVKQIAELTKDHTVKLKTINDLQSRPTMLKWLESIRITDFHNAVRGSDGKLKPSLRKELVQQFIDYYTSGEDDDNGQETEAEADDSEAAGEGLTEEAIAAAREQAELVAVAVRVLQLRSAALRITGGKLAAAAAAVCDDGRVRGLFVYAGAHTWRWAGRRVQVQNLPRPKDGLTVEEVTNRETGEKSWRYPLWEMIELHDHRKPGERSLTYKSAEALLPDRENKRFRYLTSDDAASALTRSLFIPPPVTAAGPPEPDWREHDDPRGMLFADLSNIEARVLAWLAGEEWLLKAFWDGADPYIPMAEAVFGKRETWPGYHPKTVKKHAYRQVGKIIELGSGYQLGGPKMDVYAAVNGIDLAANGTSGPECVMAYRSTHPAIAGMPEPYEWTNRETGEKEMRVIFEGGYWQQLSEAAKRVAEFGGEASVGVGAKVTFVKEGPHLMCYLPSGRRLLYRNAWVDHKNQPPFLRGKFDKDGNPRYTSALVYTSARYGPTHMYGGKWAENIVQAVSRDFLGHSIVMLERAGLPVPLHVHDEAGSIGRLSQKSKFMGTFTTPPAWATNFPLDAEGGWMPRYSKSPPPGERYKEEVWRNGAFLKPA